MLHILSVFVHISSIFHGYLHAYFKLIMLHIIRSLIINIKHAFLFILQTVGYECTKVIYFLEQIKFYTYKMCHQQKYVVWGSRNFFA